MKATSEFWINHWSKPRHARATEAFGRRPVKWYVWFASLCEALGHFFQEGMKILDYGCGRGGLGYFMSGFLKEFTYYGLEPQNVNQERLNFAAGAFAHDPRFHFGHIGSGIESEAFNSADVVVLGSIFTHLRIETCREIIEKLIARFKGRAIFFSVILQDEYFVDWKTAYGSKDAFLIVYHTKKSFDRFLRHYGLNMENVGSYRGIYKYPQQTIFQVELNGRQKAT